MSWWDEKSKAYEEGREHMLLRHAIGAVLRRIRLQQGRTLREVAGTARVSVPYLSEVERGRKEASSEILAAVCRALDVSLRALLDQASAELRYGPAPVTSRRAAGPAGEPSARTHAPDDVLAVVGPGPWVEVDVGRVLTTL